MKKVVLFKGVSEEYERAFREVEYEVVFVEPLQFVCVQRAELARRLLRDQYAGLVLTSARAAEAAAAVWDPARFVIWNRKRVYTVGEATSHKIKLLLGLDALGAGSGNAQNLADLIVKENPPSSEFLFPCGNLRSETLPETLQAAGVSVDALTVYETKESDKLRGALEELSAARAPSCLVFFSPSGCEYTHRQLQTFSNTLALLPHFAIGNSTAHKIQNLGIEVAGVAAKPKADSLVQSVQSYFTSEGIS